MSLPLSEAQAGGPPDQTIDICTSNNHTDFELVAIYDLLRLCLELIHDPPAYEIPTGQPLPPFAHKPCQGVGRDLRVYKVMHHFLWHLRCQVRGSHSGEYCKREDAPVAACCYDKFGESQYSQFCRLL